jgi:hypothetical protein
LLAVEVECLWVVVFVDAGFFAADESVVELWRALAGMQADANNSAVTTIALSHARRIPIERLTINAKTSPPDLLQKQKAQQILAL